MAVSDFLRLPGALVSDAATEYDDMGDPIPGATTSTPVRCDVQRRSVAETRDGVTISVESLVAYLPASALSAATSGARLELADGRRFTLDGPGWLVEDIFEGSDGHVEANVRMVQ